jgi:hypothetical protein
MNDGSAPPAKKTLFKTPKPVVAEGPSEPPRPTWTSEQNLICPFGKTEVFARVPAINVRGGISFPAGEVFLRYGDHFGYNSGFGFQHIWREHFHHITDHDLAMEAVRQSVADVLRPTTKIFYEAERERRASVHRLHVGIVIIELRTSPTTHYSVITGGFNPGKTKGSLIGALV